MERRKRKHTEVWLYYARTTAKQMLNERFAMIGTLLCTVTQYVDNKIALTKIYVLLDKRFTMRVKIKRGLESAHHNLNEN